MVNTETKTIGKTLKHQCHILKIEVNTIKKKKKFLEDIRLKTDFKRYKIP